MCALPWTLELMKSCRISAACGSDAAGADLADGLSPSVDEGNDDVAAGTGSVAATDPVYQPLHLQLARSLKELSRMQEAIAALQKIIEVDDQNIEAHLELGIAYRDLSQAPAARRHLQKVIELAPGTEASDRTQAALARLGVQGPP